MNSSKDPRDELRLLEEKRQSSGLSLAELARWELLQAAAAFHASMPPPPDAPPAPELAPLPPGAFLGGAEGWDEGIEPTTSPPPGAASLAEPLPRPPPIPSAAAAHTPPMSELAAQVRPPAPPQSRTRVPGEHRVVIQTIDGQAIRAILVDADLSAREIPAVQATGEVVRVPASHVKAIFFMLAPGEPAPVPEGTRVRVQFGDGRQVAGLSPDFSPSAAGFFVLPQDGRTNTARVWVFREAARQVVVG